MNARRVRQLEARLLAGDRWRNGRLVFASTIGSPLEPATVAGRLHTLLAGAGLPRQRFHDLRHRRASLLLSQHVAPRVIMDVPEHPLIALTTSIYSHVMPAMLKDADDTRDAALAVGEEGYLAGFG